MCVCVCVCVCDFLRDVCLYARVCKCVCARTCGCGCARVRVCVRNLCVYVYVWCDVSEWRDVSECDVCL